MTHLEPSLRMLSAEAIHKNICHESCNESYMGKLSFVLRRTSQATFARMVACMYDDLDTNHGNPTHELWKYAYVWLHCYTNHMLRC